ncbi:MAG: hypothetical protein HYY06_19285 [Deltaproteobacteria bacterium]|nr:hypothetical protein [Deltaproteobacteria bacterium]
MKGQGAPRSQVMELYLHVAELLGCSSDRDVAALADVSVENVANWRTGTVREFKGQTLKAVKDGLTARLGALRREIEALEAGFDHGLIPLEIEEGSGPDALQRQFADRVTYDYLGHRFLYFDPHGALAWESLIKSGYEQAAWLHAVQTCLDGWLDPGGKGPIGLALGLGRKTSPKGLDVVSLGPGEGSKEVILARHLARIEEASRSCLAWVVIGLVDVSIPLLVKAAKGVRAALRAGPAAGSRTVMPFCADFEAGKMGFIERLPTVQRPEPVGLRLVLILGNVLGNLRDEDAFVRERLSPLLRAGDMAWLEVGLRLEKIEDDPLFPMTQPEHEETAAVTNRRLLLEGPYRRWLVATGRRVPDLETRVWLRQGDDSCRVPGSINFCHDLVIKEERRACTMLYSRRYDLQGLSGWLAARGLDVERVERAGDSAQRQRVAHLLLRRR